MVPMEEKKRRRPRRMFSKEFKERAIALVLSDKDRPIKEVARDLDVRDSVIHGWLRKSRVDRGRAPPGPLKTDERLELAQLRKEIRILREEKEILRKAVAFFAKEDR